MLLEKAKEILDSSNIPQTNKDLWAEILVRSNDKCVQKFIEIFQKDYNILLAYATRLLYARIYSPESLEQYVTSTGELKLLLDTIYKKKGKFLTSKELPELKPIEMKKILYILNKNGNPFPEISKVLPFIDLICIKKYD